jgi:hypothetical protein
MSEKTISVPPESAGTVTLENFAMLAFATSLIFDTEESAISFTLLTDIRR